MSCANRNPPRLSFGNCLLGAQVTSGCAISSSHPLPAHTHSLEGQQVGKGGANRSALDIHVISTGSWYTMNNVYTAAAACIQGVRPACHRLPSLDSPMLVKCRSHLLCVMSIRDAGNCTIEVSRLSGIHIHITHINS